MAFYNKNEKATPDEIMELAKRFEAFVERVSGSGKAQTKEEENSQNA